MKQLSLKLPVNFMDSADDGVGGSLDIDWRCVNNDTIDTPRSPLSLKTQAVTRYLHAMDNVAKLHLRTRQKTEDSCQRMADLRIPDG